jgi:hypothetical protein
MTRLRPSHGTTGRRTAALVVFASLLVAGLADAGETPWWLRESGDPSLAGLGDLEAATAVAISPGGVPSAAAYPSGKDGQDTELVLRAAGGAGVERIRVPGEVRAMRFVDRGATLLLVVARRSKRRPPETYLVTIEPDSLRARRRIGLPHTAADLELWPAKGSLVVACLDELRTFTYPDLTSGPLFRLLGANTAISRIEGSLFVVSNARGLVLVDLDDRPGETEMPVRARLDPGAPVVELAVLDAAPEIAARRAAGAPPARFDLPPSPGRPTGAPSTPAPESPPANDEPVAVPDETVVAEVFEEPPIEAPGEPSVPEAEVAPAVEVTGEPAPEPAPAPSAIPDEGASIVGLVEGDRGELPIEVVALGPNNLFLEAARVTLRPDGLFAFRDLEAGTYRIVLDAGGERLIETDPPFRVVRVEDPPLPPEVRTFRIVRIR